MNNQILNDGLPLLPICLNCGNLSVEIRGRTVRCPACKSKLAVRKLAAELIKGQQVILYGVKYRRLYEGQIARYGAIRSKAALSLPTWLEAAMTVLTLKAVDGIFGNAAYDAVKAVAVHLYEQIRRRKSSLPKKSQRVPTELCADDVDFLMGLIAADQSELRKFVDYSRDYASGRSATSATVDRAIEEEVTFDRLESAFQSNPNLIVYSSGGSKRYHTRSCNYLTGAKRKLKLIKAVEMGLTPCKRCNPLPE